MEVKAIHMCLLLGKFIPAILAIIISDRKFYSSLVFNTTNISSLSLFVSRIFTYDSYDTVSSDNPTISA